MVGKIILYRFHSQACGNYQATNQEWAAEAFAELKSKLPQVSHIETGKNISKLDWACDFAVHLEFRSWAAAQEFFAEPLAVKAFEFAAKVSYEKRQIEYLF